MPEAQITIQYVNPRKENRPPSLKSDDGQYYTLSDAAYQSMLAWKGQTGLISYWTNPKGFHQATHWNAMELPKDSDPAQPIRPPHSIQPRTPAAPITPPPTVEKIPYGHTPMSSPGNVRTLPSVREQFVMRVVEAFAGTGQIAYTESALTEIVKAAKNVWILEMGETTARPQLGVGSPFEPPPPSGDQDYGDSDPWRDP